MYLLVMPLAWCLLSLVPRYTEPTNVSLLMLLEMMLESFILGVARHRRAANPDDASGGVSLSFW